jgi:hypothetical protein
MPIFAPTIQTEKRAYRPLACRTGRYDQAAADTRHLNSAEFATYRQKEEEQDLPVPHRQVTAPPDNHD